MTAFELLAAALVLVSVAPAPPLPFEVAVVAEVLAKLREVSALSLRWCLGLAGLDDELSDRLRDDAERSRVFSLRSCSGRVIPA